MKIPAAPLALVVVLATTLGASPSARAADSKTISPAVCQPYSTTTLPSELSFRAHGLKNISSNAEYVVCSISVDHDTSTSGVSHWSDTSPADVRVLFHAATAGTARCELYMGSNLVGEAFSLVNEFPLSAGEARHAAFTAEPNFQFPEVLLGRPPVSLFCRMPAGASILKIEILETGLTQT